MKKQKLKHLLAIANDEIASMHRELADKDAIIAEQVRHIEELEKDTNALVDRYKGKPMTIHWKGESFYNLDRCAEFIKDTHWLGSS